MGVLNKIFKGGQGSTVKAIEGIVAQVNVLEPAFEKLDLGELKTKTEGEKKTRENLSLSLIL